MIDCEPKRIARPDQGSKPFGGPSPWLLYTLLVTMAFLWSVNYIAGKIALQGFPALLLGALRITIAGILMLPLYFREARHNPAGVRWTLREVPALVGLGMLGVTLNQIFFVLGLSYTSVTHAAIIVGLGPILVLLISAAIRLERITVLKAMGMSIAFAGVVAIHTEHGDGHATLLGNLFVFLGSVTFALFTVFGKRATARHSATLVNTFAYTGGAIALVPLTTWLSIGFNYSHVTAAQWIALVFMAVFPSVVCYMIYYWALTHTAATRVSAFNYLQPLMAAAMAVPLLGEVVTPMLAAGGVLVLAGVYMTERG